MAFKKFKNHTSRTLVLRLPSGRDIALLPEGEAARVIIRPDHVGTVLGMPIECDDWGEIENLPEPEEGVAFIVSGIVLAALMGEDSSRRDVFAPATGPRDGAIRDAKGFPIAVTRLKGMYF